jgi:hypothetical protein
MAAMFNKGCTIPQVWKVGDVLTPASQQHPCDGASSASGQATLLRFWCVMCFSLWKYCQ